jgi:CRISPR/Cas system CSM-associated protein Csm3 (group 7 of RAMP superfamily)
MIVTMTLESGYHVGGGKGAGSNTALVLRRNGIACYPGSSLKGKARHYASQCVGAEDPNIIALFGDEGFDDVGNTQGKLVFGDLLPASMQNQNSDYRTGVTIDRYRRTAQDNGLFVSESARADKLCGVIQGLITEEQWRLLTSALTMIDHIGGDTSRGLGRVTVEIAEDEAKNEPTGHAGSSPVITSGKRVKVILTPLTPLFVGTHTAQSNYRDTLDYIPGEVFRAALAKEKAGFGAWVEELTDVAISAFRPNETLPYPITARRCKYDPEHEAIDILWASGERRCPNCGNRIEKTGRWRDIDLDDYAHISTHTAIDRFRGVAADAKLHSRRVIAPADGLTFVGYVQGGYEFGYLDGTEIGVGALQSTGFGRMKLTIVDAPFDDAVVRGRIARVKQCGKGIPAMLLTDKPHDEVLAELKDFKIMRTIHNVRRWRGVTTKQNDWGFAAPFLQVQLGSVYLLSDDGSDDIPDKLMRLEQSGNWRIADDFHFRGGTNNESG